MEFVVQHLLGRSGSSGTRGVRGPLKTHIESVVSASMLIENILLLRRCRWLTAVRPSRGLGCILIRSTSTKSKNFLSFSIQPCFIPRCEL